MNSGIISKEEKSKQIKPKADFNNLKSVFIVKIILSYIKRNKSLKIMKYNKYIQKRLDININDYKEYSQLYYSSIEIELKLEYNKYGKFINISDEEKEYYHIYFDNSNEEIKRNYLEKNEKVNSIKVIIDYQVTSFKGLSQWCFCIKSIFFNKFYRINIIDMSSMFYHCSSLKELNLSNFNTNNVTNMSEMFSKCGSLKELNLSNFNTVNVTTMTEMFRGC